jgi:glycosyltransferase involved in cell wall biosynthesis
MEKSKVSVIIPFFNRHDLLKRALESVKNQTYKNWELILVDDCGSEKINFPTDEFIVIRNEKNSGPGFSRQVGLSKSTGDFVAFLDSDDFYAPNFLAKSVEMHLRYDSKIAFTYCWSGIVEEPNETWNNTDKSYTNIFPNLVFGRQWPTAALLWNKIYIEDWNPYNMWEDYDVELRSSLCNNNIGYVNEKLVFISRGSSEGLSNQKLTLPKLEGQLKVLEFLWDNKNDYDQLLENIVDSKIVWTQVALRTLKNVKYQKEIDEKINDRFNVGIIKKLVGIDFKIVFKLSLVLLKITKKIDVIWLNIWIHLYKIRLEKLKSDSADISNLNFQ